MFRYIALMICLVFPGLAAADSDVERGAMIFGQSCARCHRTVADFDITQDSAPEIMVFLQSHRTRNDQDRADLVAYLLSLSSLSDDAQ